MLQISASTAENEILQLSLAKFHWKTTGKIELVEALFDDDLIFIHLTGEISTKADWISQLKTRKFVYDIIEQKEAAAKIYGNTAVLVGKATFTINGGGVYHLVYTEIYVKKSGQWKLVNLHTTSDYFKRK